MRRKWLIQVHLVWWWWWWWCVRFRFRFRVRVRARILSAFRCTEGWRWVGWGAYGFQLGVRIRE